jgi:hypothetical protein
MSELEHTFSGKYTTEAWENERYQIDYQKHTILNEMVLHTCRIEVQKEGEEKH